MTDRMLMSSQGQNLAWQYNNEFGSILLGVAGQL
jgi:hypothetical protein